MNNSTTVDPSRWDEVSPLIGGFTLRPYAELQKDPYYALPGFYAGERDGFPVLAFQPGWDGVDGEDAVHWKAPWPTVAQVREAIASSLLSSWLVQDREGGHDGRARNPEEHRAPQGPHRRDQRVRAHGLDLPGRRVRPGGPDGRGGGLRRHAGRGPTRPGGVVPRVRGLTQQPTEKRESWTRPRPAPTRSSRRSSRP